MVFNSTITKFLLWVFHFWYFYNDCRYSFLQRDQDSLAMCFTCFYLLLEYKSGLRNFPGWGMTIFDLIVKMLAGDNGWKLPGSFIISTVSGQEFRILSTSVMHFPYIFNIDARIARAKQVCLSQTPPMWLMNGGFLYQWNYFHCQNRLILHSTCGSKSS